MWKIYSFWYYKFCFRRGHHLNRELKMVRNIGKGQRLLLLHTQMFSRCICAFLLSFATEFCGWNRCTVLSSWQKMDLVPLSQHDVGPSKHQLSLRWWIIDMIFFFFLNKWNAIQLHSQCPPQVLGIITTEIRLHWILSKKIKIHMALHTHISLLGFPLPNWRSWDLEKANLMPDRIKARKNFVPASPTSTFMTKKNKIQSKKVVNVTFV